MGYQGIILAACFPGRGALKIHHECALSQVRTRLDLTLDIARTSNYNKQTIRSPLQMPDLIRAELGDDVIKDNVSRSGSLVL